MKQLARGEHVPAKLTYLNRATVAYIPPPPLTTHHAC